MVELLAAGLINCILPGRTFLHIPLPALNRPHMSPSFFTPVPRRWKGKERARDNMTIHGNSFECKEWSCYIARGYACCPARIRLYMLQELYPANDRSFGQRTSCYSRLRIRPSRPRSSAVTTLENQRRHASNTSDPSFREPPKLPDKDEEDSKPIRPQPSKSLSNDQAGEIVADAERNQSVITSELDGESDQRIEANNEGTSKRAYTDRQFSVANQLGTLVRAGRGDFHAESAWSAYADVIDADALSLIPVLILLDLSTMLVKSAELMSRERALTEEINEWGRRIHSIVGPLLGRVSPFSLESFRRQCVTARALALEGNVDDATAILQTIQQDHFLVAPEEQSDSLIAYAGIVLSVWRHHGNTAVLEYLVTHWITLGPHMVQREAKWKTPAMMKAAKAFLEDVHWIISQIRDPASLFAVNKNNWDVDSRERIGNFLIQVLCDGKFATDAKAVYDEMISQSLRTPFALQCTIVQSLTRERSFESATVLFLSLKPPSPVKYHLSTGLILYAHMGDNVKAEEFYNKLVDEGWVTGHDIAMLIYSYATQGRTDIVLKLFNEFFPLKPDGRRLNSPKRLHYSMVIYAFAQRGDFEGINYWLEKSSGAGFKPDDYVFTIVLRSFAIRGDVDSVAAVLKQMRASGVKPTVVTYTSVISILANRKDAVAAEAIYKRAIREGIVPDRIMISAVMNAHVEAGSWSGVIRVFDYLRTTGLRHLQLRIDIYNTLLKAYVLIGAPFNTVARLFKRLETSKIQPNEYTYALLIQSACDAGEMLVASDIFWDMDALSQERKSGSLINVYILTILMAGYLRTGDKVRAKAVYDEMAERGVQPSAISFGNIMKAYGSEGTEESFQIAEAFIKSLLESSPETRVWDKPVYGYNSALHQVYGPLINAYAKHDRLQDVERLFQDMLDSGGEPSLGVLSSLLDAYRRAFNIEGVLQLWPQIFQLGLQYSTSESLFVDESNEDDSSVKRLQSNILCIPLSIYIDALSTAGMHIEIAEVWKRFQVHGFSFDSHNWNHMAVALVRAGEPGRAFEVLEKVILPYQRQTEALLRKGRDDHPDTPLLFDDMKAYQEAMLNEIPGEPPLHRSKRRPLTVKKATERLGNSPELEGESEADQNDFAHPLYVLHRFSPTWDIWRPHGATLSVLLRTLLRLQSGSLVQPIQPGEAGVEESHLTPEDAKERREVAREMLNEIYQKCPNTVRAVLEFEQAEMLRLGPEYESTYTWE